jgi:hypothetical protein
MREPISYTSCKLSRSQFRKKLLFQFFLAVLISLLSQTAHSQSASGFPEIIEDQTEVAKAHALLDYVIETSRFIRDLNELTVIDLPVGITAGNNKESEQYAVIIENIVLRDGQTFLTAYMAFTVPGTSKKIAFKGEAIPFSFSGGILGTATMRLVSDFDIPISNTFKFILKGGHTSVTFDCFGYQEMTLDADILFDSTLFVPENPDGSVTNTQLRTSFQTTIRDWNNMLVAISVDPFQIKHLDGIGFTIRNAVLDMSDFHNPLGFILPDSHREQYSIGDNDKLWRGIYLEDLEVRLPRHFRKKSESGSPVSPQERIVFNARQILIDDLGFTGKLMATNLLPLSEGDMSGWGFSLERINIEIEASRLVAGGFSGQILVPQFTDSPLKYDALIGLNNTYSFAVAITDSLKMSLWAANLTIEPNSSLNIKVENNQFVPSLLLNGTMSLRAPFEPGGDSSKGLTIAEVAFQGMKISPIAPYLTVDHISYGSNQNLFAGFPVSVYDIGVTNESERIGLKFGLNVNFVESSSDGFGGKGFFTVWGKQETGSWSYDKLEVGSISISIEKGDAFTFNGSIFFIRGDQTYGDGFKGQVAAKFAGFEMESTILFGNTGEFRYWYADALVASQTGIPAGPIALYGFGGGAFYRMKQASVDSNQSSEIGKSSSGILYVPNRNSGLGIIASVKFGLMKTPDAFNGDAKFGISFTSSGGLDQIYFEGNGYFATGDFATSASGIMEKANYLMGENSSGLNIPKDDSKSQVHASVFINYDHPNKTFHATFDIFINVAGGVIKGVGTGGKAGYGVIHFSPNDWYIHIGTPDNPNGVVVAGLASMKTYLMMGKSVPELPSPPQQVLTSLNLAGSGYSQQYSSSNLTEGSGFAFGAFFSFDTGERRFLIFYGQLGCGVGFDILLKNYGMEASCDGQSGTLGINGWYAQGQAYAWVHASLGIVVNLPFYRGKYSILKLQVAALLQAKAPNPFWMKGNVGGSYRILGGLVKGTCKFEFEIGKQCIITGAAPFGGTEIIADLSPADAETGVDVFTTPRAVFNMPVDREFSFTDENQNTKTNRIRMGKFDVLAGNAPIAGLMEWNENRDVVAFKPSDILPGEREYKLIVEVFFQEKAGGNWNDVRRDGKVVTEEKQVTFRTGPEPDYIVPENVLYSYPGNLAFNYYPAQYSPQYIQLKQGQDLFNPGSEWVQRGRLTTPNGGEPVYFTYNYDPSAKAIRMSMPQTLTGNRVYQLELVDLPAAISQAIDVNIMEQTGQVVIGEGDQQTDLEVTTRRAEGAREELQEKVIYSMHFRASNYNSFEEKISGLNFMKATPWEIRPRVHSLNINIQGERFDKYEVVNLETTGTLVTTEPLIHETNWFSQNLGSIFDLTAAERSQLGVNPFELTPLSTYLFQSGGTRLLNPTEVTSGLPSQASVLSGMKYMVAKEAYDYLYLLKLRIANVMVNSGGSAMNSRYQSIMSMNFPAITYGQYPILIRYALPGQEDPLLNIRYIIHFQQ